MTFLSPKQSQAIDVRWMIRRDIPEAILIAQGVECEPSPWEERHFLHHLRKREVIGLVAEHRDRIVGFMLYELKPTSIVILGLAVSPWHREKGVGRKLVGRLVARLEVGRRDRITLVLRETNLPAQKFLRSLGFRGTLVARNHFRDTGEDGFLMEYQAGVRPC